MKLRILFVLVLLFIVPISYAQSDELLAFLNGSGQLVVSSSDGATRWIVTNPGQVVNETNGFGWDADGNLIFALDGFGIFSGDLTTQAITPIEATNAEQIAFLRGIPSRPNITQPNGLSADGAYAFVWAEGQYFTVSTSTASSTRLRLVGNNDNQSSGIWSDVAPFVVYWGTNNDAGGTALAVWSPENETDIVLNSGGTIPIPPIAWLPDSTNLVFRTPTGDVHVTDIACLTSGCSENPLETGMLLAPSSANHIQVTTDRAYYVDSQVVYGVDLACLDNNNCLDSRFIVGENAVSLNMMHISGDLLVYTAFVNDPNDGTDRAVQLVDLTCTPDCRPQTALNGAVAGTLSPSNDFLVVDIVDEGLNILNLAGNGLAYLTDTMGGQLGFGLSSIAWR